MIEENLEATIFASDAEKMAAIREEMPAVRACAYLNAGTNGPLPQRAHEALLTETRRELEEGRITPERYPRISAIKQETRAHIAALLGCDPSEVALTHNTTEGMNIALMGLDWRPGDEAITSWLEHPGGLYPLYLLRQRFGVKIRMTGIGSESGDPVAELRQALTPRTRAVVLSHVSWSTGRVLPLRELAEVTHAAGALLLCDAAQSCGMVPSRMAELGVDAYACSGQKWLCGPDGTGALFVRRDRLGDIAQTFTGYASFAARDNEGYFVPTKGAVRFEAATLYPPSVAALNAGLEWIEREVGWAWAYARIAALGRACYDTLAALPGVTMHTPRDEMAGLVHFAVEGIEPQELTKQLCERGVIIRHLADPAVNRVSTGFYNAEEDIARLAEGIREVRQGNA
ncbi:MAG TPA: aminotransferase class V-fold PLP-dependent enzyme [Ktedonobacterales bacterium]